MHRLAVLVCTFSVIVLSVVVDAVASDISLHVAPSGDDRAIGSQEQPLATMAGARDRVRELRGGSQSTDDAITVWIHEGTYYLDKAVEFTEEDSGTERSPVTYRAMVGERVRLVGGKDVRGWQPVTDLAGGRRFNPHARDHIVRANLAEQGITNFGALQRRGRDDVTAPAALEVYCGGRPLTLARYPNTGWLLNGEMLLDRNSQSDRLGDETVNRWQDLSSVWLHGFPVNNWADEHLPLIDNHRNRLRANGMIHGFAQGQRFYVENVLEELDSPGEWFLDRSTGVLYVWPTDTSMKSPIEVSLLDTPVSLDGVSYVTFKDITLEVARVCALEIAGGRNNTVEHCTIANAGNWGIHIYYGENHRIDSCEVSHTGEGCVRIEGGDADRLLPGGHEISNCFVHHFNRCVMGGRAGIQLYGVGHSVVKNVVREGAGEAIGVQGNEHLVMGNDISHVCLQNDDVGALYMSHDWTHRGNRVINNYFHDLGTGEFDGIVAVYLDDFTSGTTVEGNVFQRAGRGIVIGGGRDNVIRENLFVDGLAGIQVDSRGKTWAQEMVADHDSSLWARLREVLRPESPYVDRYPELATLETDQPELAKGNRIERNVFQCPVAVDFHDGLTTQHVQLVGNWLRGDPRLVSVEDGHPQLADDSPALPFGCRPVDWDSIVRVVPAVGNTVPVSVVD